MSIALVLSDVDETLLTSDKTLTPSAIDAVARLEQAGIAFAVTSGRPPRGLSSLVGPLDLRLPSAAFNGGCIVAPDLAVEHEAALDDGLVGPVVEGLLGLGLSVWAYQGARDWFVLDPRGPHVEREVSTVGFEPVVLDSFEGLRGDVVKLVGVSDDAGLVAMAEGTVRELGEGALAATRSQPYYLDVTDCSAHKGAVVTYLAERLGVPAASIATIGDGGNDIDMFAASEVSVAMGNATEAVRAAADYVTTSYDDDGFAGAIDTILSLTH